MYAVRGCITKPLNKLGRPNSNVCGYSGYRHYPCVWLQALSMCAVTGIIHVCGYRHYSHVRLQALSTCAVTGIIHVCGYRHYPCVRLQALSMEKLCHSNTAGEAITNSAAPPTGPQANYVAREGFLIIRKQSLN